MATATSPTYTIRRAKPRDIPLLANIERSAGQLFRTVGLDSVADDDPMPPEVLMSYLEAGNLWVAVAQNNEDREEEERENEKEEVEGEVKGEVVGFLAAFAISVTGMGGGEGSDEQEGVDGAEEKRGRQREMRQQDNSGTRKVLMHIAELSVHASHHRRGLGRRLMNYFEEAVTGRSRDATSSTTSSTMAATGKANMKLSSQEGQDVLGLSLTTYKDVAFNGPLYIKFGFEDVPPSEIEQVVGKRGKELWDEEQGKIARPERRCWMVKWLN